jgi:hypothetical protein
MSDTPRTDAALDEVANAKPFKPVTPAFLGVCLTLERELTAARKEIEELRKDAERYRKATALAATGKLPEAWVNGYSFAEIDADIDAAIEKERE